MLMRNAYLFLKKGQGKNQKSCIPPVGRYEEHMENTSSSPIRMPALPLVLAVVSLFLAAGFLVLTVRGLYSFPMLMGFGLPALLAATGALSLGLMTLQRRPPGAAYGFAMGGSLLGGFSLVLWTVMVPLIFVILLPAMSMDPEDSLEAQSEKQMRIIIRQTKSFHKDRGRFPVQLEELVQEGYVQLRILHDPRDTMRDRLSYRLLIQEMPPQNLWAETPVLEGRWPNDAGERLIGFLDEHIGRTR